MLRNAVIYSVLTLFLWGTNASAQESKIYFDLGEDFSHSFQWGVDGRFEPASGRSNRGLTLVELLGNEKVFRWLEISDLQRKKMELIIASFATNREKAYEAIIGSRLKAKLDVDGKDFKNYEDIHNKLREECVRGLQAEFNQFQSLALHQLARRIKVRDSGLVHNLLHGEMGKQLRLSHKEEESLLKVSKSLSIKFKKRVSKAQKKLLGELAEIIPKKMKSNLKVNFSSSDRVVPSIDHFLFSHFDDCLRFVSNGKNVASNKTRKLGVENRFAPFRADYQYGISHIVQLQLDGTYLVRQNRSVVFYQQNPILLLLGDVHYLDSLEFESGKKEEMIALHEELSDLYFNAHSERERTGEDNKKQDRENQNEIFGDMLKLLNETQKKQFFQDVILIRIRSHGFLATLIEFSKRNSMPFSTKLRERIIDVELKVREKALTIAKEIEVEYEQELVKCLNAKNQKKLKHLIGDRPRWFRPLVARLIYDLEMAGIYE